LPPDAHIIEPAGDTMPAAVTMLHTHSQRWPHLVALPISAQRQTVLLAQRAAVAASLTVA
jgi:hypothetical protein